ncbi:uncharacterized protein LOC132640931 [Lycium barbarum]|uniref:uncharacterized protein LOC132640931 n=1 Tax=Lycium barbarum TaxID=112863 RepID=UPI00293F5656|nr:uncharacterized protein LOC132640931 [Lycium barbarum]
MDRACTVVCFKFVSTSVHGVLVFFFLHGFFGIIRHCSSFNSNEPHMAGCHNCCYGWGMWDLFPASMEACFALVVVFVVILAILGIAYSFLAATMAIQRFWQRHYHILTKRELLTQLNIAERHRRVATAQRMSRTTGHDQTDIRPRTTRS